MGQFSHKMHMNLILSGMLSAWEDEAGPEEEAWELSLCRCQEADLQEHLEEGPMKTEELGRTSRQGGSQGVQGGWERQAGSAPRGKAVNREQQVAGE